MTAAERYESAKEIYKSYGVDVEAAMSRLPCPCIAGRETM